MATEWLRQDYLLSVWMSSEQLHTTNLALPDGLWAIRKTLSLSHLRWLVGTWRKRKRNETHNEKMDTIDWGRWDEKRRVPGSLAPVRQSLLKSKAGNQQSSQTAALALQSPSPVIHPFIPPHLFSVLHSSAFKPTVPSAISVLSRLPDRKLVSVRDCACLI